MTIGDEKKNDNKKKEFHVTNVGIQAITPMSMMRSRQ